MIPFVWSRSKKASCTCTIVERDDVTRPDVVS